MKVGDNLDRHKIPEEFEFWPRLQKCRQICIFSMPLVFTGIYGKYGGKYGIYGKFNGQLSNISVVYFRCV